MKRREFIFLLGGAATAVPLAARAERENIPRVGILTPAASAGAAMMRVLRNSFLDLGYVEGKTIILDFAFADGDLARMPALADGLVRQKVAVIVTDGGFPVNHAAQAATSTIPIVAAMLTNPVEGGFAKSLPHPGGNVTGFILTVVETSDKRLELLKNAFPELRKVALIWMKGSSGPLYAESVARAAPSLNIQVESFVVDGVDDIARGFNAAAASGVDGMMTFPDGVFFNHRVEIVTLVAASKVPAIYPEREYVEAGGLMSYGAVVAENFRNAARYVDRILKGEEPGDLPIQAPTKFELAINLKTANVLGLTIPPSVLVRADEVIE
jgi:putative tryptophan/tyrosine transport system substrate-binding protein